MAPDNFDVAVNKYKKHLKRQIVIKYKQISNGPVRRDCNFIIKIKEDGKWIYMDKLGLYDTEWIIIF